MPTLFTPIPFLRSTHEFGDGDVSGSIVAHQDLLIAGLRANAIDEVCILPERFNPATAAKTLRQVEASLALQGNELGQRINVRSIRWLVSRTNRGRNDVIGIGRSLDLPDLAQLRAVFMCPVPLIGIVHSVFFPSIAQSLQAVLTCCRACDALVVTSESARRALMCLLEQARANLATAIPQADKLPLPRIERIPLGLEDHFCDSFEKHSSRQQLGVPQSAVILLYVGRLSEEYKANLDILIRLFMMLHEEFPELYLVLAGSTIHSRTDWVSLGWGLSGDTAGHVIVIPNFPRMLKKAIYAAADVFVSPVDNIQESFGLSILEAMGSGLPVVAANWSGYRDLVKDGETGFLVDTMIDPGVWEEADALGSFAFTPITERVLAQQTIVHPEQFIQRVRLLLSDPLLRVRFGNSGRARVQSQFVWSRVIAKFTALWQDQLAIIDRDDDPWIAPLHLRPAFEHYASTSTEPDLMVVGVHQPQCRRSMNGFRRNTSH